MHDVDRERYSRQILFAGIGEEGMQRLREATVAVVGCGALGAFHAGALTRAGVGRLRLIDRDYVEWSNLQRQWLYDEADARDSLPKAAAAARHLAAINAGVMVEPHIVDLNPDTLDDLLSGSDLILDGTDNFETRYLLNDWAVAHSVPWIYGGAVGAYGLAMPILPGRAACFECLYPEPPSGAQPTCETAGVLNTITSLVASWQVSLALRILCQGTAAVEPRLTIMDAWNGTVRQVALPPRDDNCPACALKTCRHLSGAGRAPISLCGRNAVQIHDRKRPLDLAGLAARLAPLGEVRANDFALRFSTPPYELTIFPDGRAIIKGTTDPGLARSLYSRYVGN
jgi:molybdopterin/thiamine biosynthesis adenylyltransferase